MSDQRVTDRLERFIANPRRAVWTLSLPMMVTGLSSVAYHVVDTAFIGRLGPTALAGLAVATPLWAAVIAFGQGVGSGIAALVAQAIGRKDIPAAERWASATIGIGLAIGLGFTASGVAGGPWLLGRLGGVGPVGAAAWDYFAILALAGPLIVCGAFWRYLLIGQGDSRTPMFVVVVMSLINLVLDPLFIFTAGWGIRGAALATVAAQLCGVVLMGHAVFAARRRLLRIRLCYVVPTGRTIRAVFAMGLPATLTYIVGGALGYALINSVVANFGPSALAGYGIGIRVEHVVVLPLIGMGFGAVTVISMFAGAGRTDLVSAVVAYILRWGVTFATVFAVSACLMRSQVVAIFCQDGATIAVGCRFLLFMAVTCPLAAVTIVGGRVLLGLGRPNLLLATTVVRAVAVPVPLAYVSVYLLKWPLDGVWWAILVGAAVSAAWTFTLLRQLVWRRHLPPQPC